jgi:hypothetical protein
MSAATNNTYLAAGAAAVVAYVAYRSYSQSKKLKGERLSKESAEAGLTQAHRAGGIYSTEHEATDFQEFPPSHNKVLSVKRDIFGIPVTEVQQEDGSILRVHTSHWQHLL